MMDKKIILFKNNIIYLNKFNIIIKGLLGKIFINPYNTSYNYNIKKKQKKINIIKNSYNILLNNYILATIKGYIRKLKLLGMGYKFERINSKKISINLGYSHPVYINIPNCIFVKILDRNTKLILVSYNLSILTNFLNKILILKRRNVYNGKNIILLK